jgi:hypothetical protein
MSECEVPEGIRVCPGVWNFGQPDSPGDYEWWSAKHSIRPWEATVFIGYDGNVRGWGRDVWWRKLSVSHSWSFRGMQIGDPFHGGWCSTFIHVSDGIIHDNSIQNFVPNFLKPWLGKPFAELVHYRLVTSCDSRLIRIQ